MKMIASQTQKGIIAQLKAELRANELGYIVSKPTTDCCRYDMIIDDGKTLRRIQIKYCGQEPTDAKGTVVLDLRKFSINGVSRPFYSKDEIDAVVAYIAPIDKLCYFPIEFINGRKTIKIRYDGSGKRKYPNVTNCQEYYW